MEFKIPTGKEESSGGNGSGADMKDTNKLLKKLDKSMIANIDVWEILSGFVSSLGKLIEPLIKVLSILLMVAFLPLLPLIILLTKGFALLIKLFTGGFGNVAQMIGKMLIGLLLIVLAFLLAPFVAGGLAIAAFFVLLGVGIMLMADGIANFVIWIGGFIADMAKWAWNILVTGFTAIGEAFANFWNWLKGVPGKVWEMLKTAWDWLGEKIKSVWDIIKLPFDWLKDALKDLINSVISFVNSIIPGSAFDVPQLAKGGIVNSPTLAMVGEAGPEAIIPLSKMGGMGTTININNPVVREDSDIKKLTNAVSRELQKRGNRGFSNG